MRKVAVPSEEGNVARHFGRCPEYTIFELDGSQILHKERLENPGHSPGFLPRFLKEKGVDCILAGGMGRKAKDLFDSAGIEVVTGITGPVEAGLKSYLKGTLTTSQEDLCDHSGDDDHSHHHH